MAGNGAAITECHAQRYKLPLDQPLQDANHGLQTFFEIVTATLTRADGQSGTGYTYTVGKGGHAIQAMIEHDLAPLLVGEAVDDIDRLYDRMLLETHYVGRGGIAGFAISAVDIALWDLRGRVHGRPLWQEAGGHASRTRAYRGGVDLNLSESELVASVQGHLDKGYRAVKIKVGKADPQEDASRIRAVRGLVGPDFPLMVDANYAYDLERARVAARLFKPFGLVWLEEPLQPDEYAAYGRLALETDMPLAQGENLHSEAEFKLALEHSRLSFLQPDASNCGGITGWLRAAQLAAWAGIPVCSHGMHELHVSLVAAQPHAGWLEVHSFPIDRYTRRPLVMEDGEALAPDQPGCGVEFDRARLEEAALP